MKYLTSFIIILLIFSCESDSLPVPEPIEPDDLSNATIWRGETKAFTKVDNSDPNSEENQDRITSNVWITRGVSGGEIYNFVTESGSTKGQSPEGTLWAVGSIDDLSSLSFSSFNFNWLLTSHLLLGPLVFSSGCRFRMRDRFGWGVGWFLLALGGFWLVWG